MEELSREKVANEKLKMPGNFDFNRVYKIGGKQYDRENLWTI